MYQQWQEKRRSHEMQNRLSEVLRAQDTSEVALVDPLQGQRSDQGCTDTRTVFGSEDLNGVLLVLAGFGGPVEDLAESHRATGLEVRVLVEDGAVSANVAGLVALLLADSSDTTRGQAGGAGANELSRPADELELGAVGLDVKLVKEEVKGLLKVLIGVTENSCQHMKYTIGTRGTARTPQW